MAETDRPRSATIPFLLLGDRPSVAAAVAFPAGAVHVGTKADGGMDRVAEFVAKLPRFRCEPRLPFAQPSAWR
jgi:hypothetical protein